MGTVLLHKTYPGHCVCRRGHSKTTDMVFLGFCVCTDLGGEVVSHDKIDFQICCIFVNGAIVFQTFCNFLHVNLLPSSHVHRVIWFSAIGKDTDVSYVCGTSIVICRLALWLEVVCLGGGGGGGARGETGV